ncbi:MAG: hypothetical protein IIW63_08670 [Clostridia bacterium]|nr:hypothetical protein [Clostridia bacterium]
MKKIAALFLLFIILLCGCKKQDINLEDTVWKYGNDVIIYFYENGNGQLDVDGTKLSFTYTLQGDTLNTVCTEEELAASHGLDAVPFFGTNSISFEDGFLYVGSWELTEIK